MPEPRVYNSGPRLTEAKLRSLEDLIGAKLPKAYREFLLQHNGGSTDPEGFTSKQGRPSSILDIFFGLGIKDRMWDLRNQFRKTRKEMPAEVLPIALDLGGNKICLAFKGTNRGKLYFWDHEGVPEPDDIEARFPEIDWGEDSDDEPRTELQSDWPGHPDLTLLADSFEEFLSNFTEDE